MQPAITGLARFALRLAKGDALGPAEVEGYIAQGKRRVWDRGRPGYQRALDMLLDKLHGRPFVSEVPFHAPDRVTAAAPIADLSRAAIAMVTTGGLVKKGNPDRQVAANATRYHRHSVKAAQADAGGLGRRTTRGTSTTSSTRIRTTSCRCPSCAISRARGRSAACTSGCTRCPGVSTPVAMARELGRSIAEDLREARVDGVLLVAT